MKKILGFMAIAGVLKTEHRGSLSGLCEMKKKENNKKLDRGYKP
jgi:hypothetical protein